VVTDTRQIRVIVIPTDDAEAPHAVQIDAAALDALLGGRGCLTSLPGTEAQLYNNDRARDLDLPPNPRATRFVTRYVPGFAHADMILGPAVIIGIADDGLEGDVPGDIEALALMSA